VFHIIKRHLQNVIKQCLFLTLWW